jgi:hypothetical protein
MKDKFKGTRMTWILRMDADEEFFGLRFAQQKKTLCGYLWPSVVKSSLPRLIPDMRPK